MKCNKTASSVIIDRFKLPKLIDTTATFDEILVSDDNIPLYRNYYNVNVGGTGIPKYNKRRFGVIWVGMNDSERWKNISFVGKHNMRNIDDILKYDMASYLDIHVIFDNDIINSADYRDISNMAFKINDDMRVKSLDVIGYDASKDNKQFSVGMVTTDIILAITCGRTII